MIHDDMSFCGFENLSLRKSHSKRQCVERRTFDMIMNFRYVKLGTSSKLQCRAVNSSLKLNLEVYNSPKKIFQFMKRFNKTFSHIF